MAKSAENQLSEENRQLRGELDWQGTVIDSIRQIKASLSAKSETERDEFKCEIERLNAQISKEQSQHSDQVKSSNTRISELEARIKDADSSKDKALADSIK